MLKKIWNQIKSNCLKSLKDNIEVGCNICSQDFNKFYIDDIVYGNDSEVEIDDGNLFSIGTFHSHAVTNILSWEFSYGDVSSGVNGKERYMYLSVDKDIYGVDMSKYTKSIRNCTNGKIDIYKLTEIINNGKVML